RASDGDVRRLCRELDDLQVVLVHGQVEDVLDRVQTGRRADIDGPAQIALFGIEACKRRQSARVGHGLDAAEALQRPYQQLRLVALPEQIGGWRQLDAIVPQRRGGGRGAVVRGGRA